MNRKKDEFKRPKWFKKSWEKEVDDLIKQKEKIPNEEPKQPEIRVVARATDEKRLALKDWIEGMGIDLAHLFRMRNGPIDVWKNSIKVELFKQFDQVDPYVEGVFTDLIEKAYIAGYEVGIDASKQPNDIGITFTTDATWNKENEEEI